MAMTLSIDDDLKESYTEVCKSIGLTPSAAFNVFARAVVREKGIPFRVSAVSDAELERRLSEIALARAVRAGLGDHATDEVLLDGKPLGYGDEE